ncbi:MAG: metallophosphoesterase [Planctomycetota bacterium]|jgi:3',5'-cyclic AMP phosphodiesterase CpdA
MGKRSRRDFLKGAALAGAGLGMPGWALAEEASGRTRPSRGAAGKDPREQEGGGFHFFHAADTQLFWGKDPVGRWRSVVEQANRLRPAFLVVGGDLLNRDGDAKKVDLKKDEERARAYLEVAGRLSKDIPLCNVAGNHDVCNRPTPVTIAWYRKRFGRIWYSFEHGECLFVVLESDIMKHPEGASDLAREQLVWLAGVLRASDRKRYLQKIVFMHHPMCLKSADEKDAYFNIPGKMRAELLTLFHRHRVGAVFSGHYHRNARVKASAKMRVGGRVIASEIDLVTTSGVAKPLGKDPPGFRIVKVSAEGIAHAYYAHEDVPARLE